MELLVVTLAYTMPGRDADVLARVRLVSDTVRNAPGLVTARFYRSRGDGSYYFMLTTWDDEESWQRARERHNPKGLLLGSTTELLTSAPQQWLMRYLWGYTRPAATPTVAAAHLANIRLDQAELAQQGCIEGLRQNMLQPSLAFGFLARGTHEESLVARSPSQPGVDASYQQGTLFLSLFSWAGEEDREDFYSEPRYRTINRLMSSLGATHILQLEPM